MKNIKSFSLVILIMFFLTGCDVNYNLKIDKKMKLTEEITALEDKKYNDLAHDFLLDRISNVYAARYGGVDIYVGDNPYDFGVVTEGVMIGNSIRKQHKSISSYGKDSAVFRDLIKEYKIDETDEFVNLKASLNDDLYDTRDLAHIFIPDNIKINIDLPFRVINDNADSKKGNIYTWNITKDKRNVDLILSFDKKHLSNHIYILNIGISYGILLVSGIILTIGIIAFIVSRKLKSINRI